MVRIWPGRNFRGSTRGLAATKALSLTPCFRAITARVSRGLTTYVRADRASDGLILDGVGAAAGPGLLEGTDTRGAGLDTTGGGEVIIGDKGGISTRFDAIWARWRFSPSTCLRKFSFSAASFCKAMASAGDKIPTASLVANSCLQALIHSLTLGASSEAGCRWRNRW